jgi:cytochrome c
MPMQHSYVRNVVGKVAPRTLGLVCAAGMSVSLLAWGETAKPGPEAFNNNCRTCHSVKEGDNRVGPSLHNVIGRKAGTAPGYPSYSQALKSSGVTWDETTLDKFITQPDAFIPDNNMRPFNGISDPAVRAKIIEYLKSNP